MGDDRVLVVGTGEVGQMLLQKILQNRKLGYHVIGVIDSGKSDRNQRLMGMPVLGTLVDIPWVIEQHQVDEVIIGLPESSHQELVGIISLCEREKVGIRVFPDVFQIMASEVGIGDLGGLPLLTMRDVALQGWKLTLKRGMDIVVSGDWPGADQSVPIVDRAAGQAGQSRPGVLYSRAHGAGCDAVQDDQVPLDADGCGTGRPRLDDARTTRGAPNWAA